MKKLYWGSVMAQPDFCSGLWVRAKVRPWWYWLAARAWLFSYIVWRRQETARMDWRTAWDVSHVVFAGGFVGPIEVHEGAPPE